jgi:hypothetical protein
MEAGATLAIAALAMTGIVRSRFILVYLNASLQTSDEQDSFTELCGLRDSTWKAIQILRLCGSTSLLANDSADCLESLLQRSTDDMTSVSQPTGESFLSGFVAMTRDIAAFSVTVKKTDLTPSFLAGQPSLFLEESVPSSGNFDWPAVEGLEWSTLFGWVGSFPPAA